MVAFGNAGKRSLFGNGAATEILSVSGRGRRLLWFAVKNRDGGFGRRRFFGAQDREILTKHAPAAKRSAEDVPPRRRERGHSCGLAVMAHGLRCRGDCGAAWVHGRASRRCAGGGCRCNFMPHDSVPGNRGGEEGGYHPGKRNGNERCRFTKKFVVVSGTDAGSRGHSARRNGFEDHG